MEDSDLEQMLAFDPLLVYRYITDEGKLRHDLELLGLTDDFLTSIGSYSDEVRRKPLVCGFAFSSDMTRVALIEKKRPAWQKDKHNGIGGKTEEWDLSSYHAMSREFEEETGAIVSWNQWTHFLTLNSCGVEGVRTTIAFFFTCGDEILDTITSTTDEVVKIFEVVDVVTRTDYSAPMIPNIPWLVAMARSYTQETAQIMTLTEHGRKDRL